MDKEKPQEAPNNSQSEHYEFLNKDISKFLFCPACRLLMKNPIRLHPCGHTFCDKCAPKLGKCAKCSHKVIAAQKDLVGQGLVNEFFVRCTNGDCPYKGTFQDFKKLHQGNCKLKVGLELWMQSMQNSLQQLDAAKIKQRHSSANQSNQGSGFKTAANQQNLSSHSKTAKSIEISWEDQSFSKRQLRKQF